MSDNRARDPTPVLADGALPTDELWPSDGCHRARATSSRVPCIRLVLFHFPLRSSVTASPTFIRSANRPSGRYSSGLPSTIEGLAPRTGHFRRMWATNKRSPPRAHPWRHLRRVRATGPRFGRRGSKFRHLRRVRATVEFGTAMTIGSGHLRRVRAPRSRISSQRLLNQGFAFIRDDPYAWLSAVAENCAAGPIV